MEVEFPIKIGNNPKSIDYVLRVDGVPKVVVDAKAEYKSVTDEKHIDQTNQYACHLKIKAPYFIVSNGKELAIFKLKKNLMSHLQFLS